MKFKSNINIAQRRDEDGPQHTGTLNIEQPQQCRQPSRGVQRSMHMQHEPYYGWLRSLQGQSTEPGQKDTMCGSQGTFLFLSQSLLGLNMGCQGIKQPQKIRLENKFSVQIKTEKVWDLNSWQSACSFNLTDSNSDIDAYVQEMICFLSAFSFCILIFPLFWVSFLGLGEGVHQKAERLCNLRRFQIQGTLCHLHIHPDSW